MRHSWGQHSRRRNPARRRHPISTRKARRGLHLHRHAGKRKARRRRRSKVSWRWCHVSWSGPSNATNRPSKTYRCGGSGSGNCNDRHSAASRARCTRASTCTRLARCCRRPHHLQRHYIRAAHKHEAQRAFIFPEIAALDSNTTKLFRVAKNNLWVWRKEGEAVRIRVQALAHARRREIMPQLILTFRKRSYARNVPSIVRSPATVIRRRAPICGEGVGNW